MIYLIILVLLFIAELIYFCIANQHNIIDKPNERSSHSTIVLRGGGIIFLIGAWIWSLFFGFQYPWFLAGLTLVAGRREFYRWHPFIAGFGEIGSTVCCRCNGILSTWHIALVNVVDYTVALIVYVGATNVINFMDGINGITAGYSLAVLIPLVLLIGIWTL